MIYDMIYLLTAIGLPPGGSSTVHIYTQTIHERHKNLGGVQAVPRLGDDDDDDDNDDDGDDDNNNNCSQIRTKQIHCVGERRICEY